MSNDKERDEVKISELERAKMSLMNPEIIAHKLDSRTIDEVAKPIIERTLKEGIETVWDRFEIQQPPCRYCSAGVSCSRCAMGPCRIMPGIRERGVCGADANLIVARNLLDMLATGAAAHSDHGRDIVETLYKTAIGESDGYVITDGQKLNVLAAEFGIDVEGRSENDVARDLSLAMLEEYGTIKNRLQLTERAPQQTRDLWDKAGITPRSVDREVVESMHRVHMGVGASYANILLHGLRTALSDGWGGSMFATEISDVLFGTPAPIMSSMNLGVIRKIW
jgi:carbon-monoxide dehydrogenase catalytic subunit